MKLVLAGGSGQVGVSLARHFVAGGHRVVVLSRGPKHQHSWPEVAWDGKTLGDWAQQIDGADVVINLAGRTVNCRYTDANRQQMMDSRVDSTRVIGQAIHQAKHAPAVWLQASTATIYSHRFDAPNDEETGRIPGSDGEPESKWQFSIEIAKAWERELEQAETPHTRKVALRSAMVMSADPGGIFATLLGLVRRGLGGTSGNGKQYVSWIHEQDFLAAVNWLIAKEHLQGAVNLSSPHPLPNREFIKALREAWGARIGLPATAWMLELGAIFLRTESELILKSRRVVPKRLQDDGFAFPYADWPSAAKDLCEQWRDQAG